MENTKCECGHQNHHGTVLCESCGKPLQDTNDTAPLEMRYDGVARRSQKTKKSWIDRIWSFFSSVKVAVYLILITFIVSIPGTFFQQEDSFIGEVDFLAFYEKEYGWFGKVAYYLGITHSYESWWFRGLLAMIGASLVICSLDRVLPLYRALSKQKLRKHPQFILRQKVVFQGEVPAEKGQAERGWLDQFSKQLKKKRYRVHMEDGALLAEKNRFSRWGPYINHIGLIVFLLAVLARSLPGWHMDSYVWSLEHDTVRLGDTAYFLKNEKFTVEFYNPDEIPQSMLDKGQTIAKTYRVDAVLYQCTDNCNSVEPKLEEVKRHEIEVNYPLQHEDLLVYLVDYERSTQLLSMNITLKHMGSGEAVGQFQLDMKNPSASYEVGGYSIFIEDYFPELTIREGKPATNSRDPINPAFIVQITGPDLPEEGERYMFIPMMGVMTLLGGDQIDLTQPNQGSFEFAIGSDEDVQLSEYSAFLNLRKDKAMPYIWVGAAISMIGLVMGFYWQHRRIWLRLDGNQLSLGAHTNKNWFGLRKEIADALKKTGVSVDPKALANEVNKS
ncbi:cytochrome c biogenesis protein ResB [Marinicrinis lubricantis]|uniref:Cytochrome c biogenesis protein ResB n=1 Tax=Marinicrinis lubricantis TaxID=2086470 RepID=A0ABW1ISL7_9BACL